MSDKYRSKSMTDLRLSGWELLFIFVFATSSLKISATVIALQIELLLLSFLSLDKGL